MSYTDAQLLAEARNRAFEGLVLITTLREQRHGDLKKTLREHFSACLDAIDELGPSGPVEPPDPPIGYAPTNPAPIGPQESHG